MDRLILHPLSISRGKELHTLVTSAFIHADMSHLFFNMISLYSFAFHLEAYVGSFSIFVVYFGAVLAANLATVYRHKRNPLYRSLGASGGVSGVIFSAVIYFPDISIGFFFIPVGIPGPIFAILYLLYCYYAGQKMDSNINHDAHLWGALTGVVLTFGLNPQLLSAWAERILGT